MEAHINLARVNNLLRHNIKRKHIVIFLIFLISLILLRQIIITIALIIMGGFSIIYKRYISIGLDFELCSLCAVAIGSAYGAKFGAIAGGTSILLALIINGHALQNPFFTLIKVISYAVLGLVAGIFAGANLLLIAAAYTFIADLIFVLVALQTGGNPGNLVVFLTTHAFIVLFQLKLLLPVAKILL